MVKDGKTVNTYFLYDGSNVIMEADEEGVTAKNTYGGPLLLRTVFHEDGSEETYQYMYNAHGDVVTLLSDGEVAATYYYDSFGNILEQTGEVDNSILYAGYQYDEETGLYYINARMYDPVTARFLQVDTYPGNQNDPLSLNFYTYCLNNPHKYVDPSGHFVITAAAVLLIARIGVALISGIVSAKGEYDRQVEEGDNYTNWGSVIFVGIANAGISFLTFGLGQGAAAVAGTGAKAVLKHIGKAVVRDVALGAVADMGVETARQLVTGTKITNLEYDRITEAGVYGGIAGGASSLAGAGLESFMQTRVAQKALVKLTDMANKGADAVQNAFRKVAKKSGTTVGLEEPKFKMNLQFFASDEVYQGGIPSGYYKDANGRWHRPNGQFASNVEVGLPSSSDHYLNRPYIRQGTIDVVNEYTRVNYKTGQIYDEISRKWVNPSNVELGHTVGNEYWYWRNWAEEQGMTQVQFNDFMNNPEFYRWQDIISNRSHLYEDPH